MGMGIRAISNAFELSRNTVRRYVRMFQDSGLSPDQLMSMSEHHLQEMFGDKGREHVPTQREAELEALLPDYANRLKKRGTTKASLYAEYSRDHPDGYRISSFCKHLTRYMIGIKVVGHVEHHAGEQMYIDYAGDKLKVYDEATGEERGVEVFVAILPCSHYTYCEAVWSQRKEDLIKACENAMHFFGGVPQAIVPDNLKSAVVRSDRHEPVINEEFAAMADHYETAVYPARVRHPKDKALVENAVKLMYRSVYADIEGLVFHDLESLNAAILQSLEAFNGRKLTGRKESRRELFEQVEKDILRPLPAIRYQMKSRVSVTVMGNSYVTLFKHHYSVPKEYVGKRVDIVYDADSIEVYYGLKLVTGHTRDDTPYEYSRKDAHNLPGRHGSYEKDMDDVYKRAAQIDNIVLLYLKEVARIKKYPPQAFRSCRAILSLEGKFGLDRLVAACACATQARRYGYADVLDILNHGDDACFLPSADNEPMGDSMKPLPQHKNIRGRDYYTNPTLSNKKTKDNGSK